MTLRCRAMLTGLVVACVVLAAATPTLLRATPTLDPTDPRFAFVDIYIETTQPLAAYQLQIAPQRGRFYISGVEGGEHERFARPPYYDRDAIDAGRADRVILAAFTTAEAAKLPTGKVRVARVHLFIEGGEAVRYAGKLTVAAGAAGKPIEARLIIEEGTAE